MKKLISPFRVGLLVIASAGLLFGLLQFVKKGGMSERESVRVYGLFRDASGLNRRSRVQVAGISVGEIDLIELSGTRAKVWLKIRRDVGARQDASLAKRSESLLGDYMLDLDPGTADSPLLKDGDEIKRVIDKQGMDAALESLSRISEDVEQVTYALRQALGGEKGAQSLDQIVRNLVSVSSGVDAIVRENQSRLGAILTDAQAIAGDVRTVTADQKDNVEKIVANAEAVTRDARDVVATVKRILAQGDPAAQDGDISQIVSQLRESVAKLDRTLQNVEEVTEKIKDGKGTAGVLLADERLGQKLGETVEDISDFANRLTQTKIEVGIRAEYGFTQGAATDTLGVRIIPKPDKYYLIEIVDDARDMVEEELIQQNPPAAGEPASQIRRVTRDQVKFTAQFAKRYYFTTLRFGVTENTGGIGADIHLFDDHLTIKLDAFNFSVSTLEYPRLRAGIRLTLANHVMLTAGIDDILNTPVRDAFSHKLIAGRDVFVGAGVYFTDDDLKSILTFIPIPTPK